MITVMKHNMDEQNTTKGMENTSTLSQVKSTSFPTLELNIFVKTLQMHNDASETDSSLKFFTQVLIL
jgi:hypothetical protein